MVNIIEINDNDMKTFIPKAVSFMQEHYGSTKGKYYKYESQGNEYFFNRNDNRIVVMWDYEGEFWYSAFYMDENYNITDLDLEEFSVNIAGEDLIFYIPNSPIEHYFYSVQNTNDEIYNTMLVYTQWNKETDDRLTMLYRYIVNEDIINLIYDYQIETPSSIQFDKNTSKIVKKGRRPFCSQKYLLFKSLPTDIYYNKFVEKSSAVDKDNCLQRYMRWYGRGDCPITLFPFSEAFTREEMFKRFENMGFRTSIPKDVVDSNNEGFVNLEEFMEIAELLKTLDSIEDQVSEKLVLRPGGANENN